jgi:excisionase family DNA binding protein
MKPLLRVRDVAALLTCSPRYVRALAQRGEIASIKLGTDYRFTEADVVAFITRQRHAAELDRQ